MPQFKPLIAKGKSTGYLTIEEVSKSMPAEMHTEDCIEEIMT
ncbi:MAG: RNA polymerase sigma factor region1.1 domain-containing protein, partial [Mailhella sp.]|nr:RNA polymerase sigma factor region1.1 domain-containing protein [Mailhella sp.]